MSDFGLMKKTVVEGNGQQYKQLPTGKAIGDNESKLPIIGNTSQLFLIAFRASQGQFK